MITNWNNRRLGKAFAHYNRKYWRGRLPAYRVEIVDLREKNFVGQCDCRDRCISIDVAQHESDKGVRGTLLHEMCHAAAGRNRFNHGYPFWQQVESILRQGAPMSVTCSEAPGLRIYDGAVPRKFPLSRIAMEKVEAHRRRVIQAIFKRAKRCTAHEVAEREIIVTFEDAAPEMTWRQTLVAVGDEYGLVDVGGKPKNRWAAHVVAEGKKAYQRARREYLQDKKRQTALFGEPTVKDV